MASSIKAHRAVAAGISGGLGFALPLMAAAATLPFAGAHEVVRANALPVAAGALAGVALFALSDRLLERREERLADEEEEAAAFTSVFSGVEDAHPAVAGRSMAEDPFAPRAHAKHAHRAVPKGVPVISRAVDALDEADAWAEIDAMLSGDSPISCDPTRSKDIYEIAFEELRRTEQAHETAAAKPAAAAAAVSRPAASQPAAARHSSPESTDVFLALAGKRVPARPVIAASAPVTPGPAVTASIPTAAFDTDDAEEASARDAALASLYGASPRVQPAPTPAPSVAVADYSGHERTWAAALAILNEDMPGSASVVAPAAQPVPSQTSFVAPDRMALVAEGGNATRSHAHVNALLEEEFSKVPSSSVRSKSHEFLRVIQGGTASMPRLQAQA